MPSSTVLLRVCFFTLTVSIATLAACSQSSSPAWFGLAPPPGLGDVHASVIDVSAIQAPPATIPDGEEEFAELRGQNIQSYVRDIVEFSKQSREQGNKVWGRVTGFPSAQATVEWTAEQFRAAGLQNVAVQEYNQDADFWWATDWRVKLVGNTVFGEGSQDIVFESALPTGDSFIEQESLQGQPVYVGAITDPIPDTDIRGKIAVQTLTPQTGAYSERTPTRERAQQLMAKGAIAVINIVKQIGNMHVRDFSNCNGPCFNIGTADGDFLLSVMDKAAATKTAEPLTLDLSLDAKMLSGLTGHNAVGVVPGDSDEIVIVNAHADGWFDAAGDNADGLAVLIAMARHFAQPEHKPARTLVFVASGGHHSRGLNGPGHFVPMNPQIAEKTVLVLNLEHIAQLNFVSGDWIVNPTEQQMSWGISNENAWLTDLTRRGMARYGFNLNPEFRAAVPGDLGGYRSLNVPMVEAIHSGPLYHTSGDVFDTISVPGLERAARFYTFFVNEVAQAGRDLFDHE